MCLSLFDGQRNLLEDALSTYFGHPGAQPPQPPGKSWNNVAHFAVADISSLEVLGKLTHCAVFANLPFPVALAWLCRSMLVLPSAIVSRNIFVSFSFSLRKSRYNAVLEEAERGAGLVHLFMYCLFLCLL